LKHSTLFRRLGSAFVALGLLCAVVIAAGVWRSSAVRKDEKAEGRRKYHARIRDGVGREVELASGDSPAFDFCGYQHGDAYTTYKWSYDNPDGTTTTCEFNRNDYGQGSFNVDVGIDCSKVTINKRVREFLDETPDL
jgi:hypothetical protein